MGTKGPLPMPPGCSPAPSLAPAHVSMVVGLFAEVCHRVGKEWGPCFRCFLHLPCLQPHAIDHGTVPAQGVGTMRPTTPGAVPGAVLCILSHHCPLSCFFQSCRPLLGLETSFLLQTPLLVLLPLFLRTTGMRVPCSHFPWHLCTASVPCPLRPGHGSVVWCRRVVIGSVHPPTLPHACTQRCP